MPSLRKGVKKRGDKVGISVPNKKREKNLSNQKMRKRGMRNAAINQTKLSEKG